VSFRGRSSSEGLTDEYAEEERKKNVGKSRREGEGETHPKTEGGGWGNVERSAEGSA